MQKYISKLIKIDQFITLDDFIGTALYHPFYGYYMKNNPIQKDFTTSPKVSNAFGIIIASYFLEKILKTNYYGFKKIHFVEFGGGDGNLTFDIMNFLMSTEKLNNPNIDFIVKKIHLHLVEISEKLENIQRNKLIDFDVPKYFCDNPGVFFSAFENSFKRKSKELFVFYSNEFFDALPIKQYCFSDGNFYEIVVMEENKKFIMGRKIINKKIIQYMPTDAKEGDIIEIPMLGWPIISKITDFMKNNPSIFMMIDYGYTENKRMSTLQSIYKKKKQTDILKNIGNSDITHLVDFSFFKKIFENGEIDADIQTQREFLIKNGIESLINDQNRAGINRLIEENQMGDLFKVLTSDSCFHKKFN